MKFAFCIRTFMLSAAVTERQTCQLSAFKRCQPYHRHWQRTWGTPTCWNSVPFL